MLQISRPYGKYANIEKAQNNLHLWFYTYRMVVQKSIFIQFTTQFQYKQKFAQ